MVFVFLIRFFPFSLCRIGNDSCVFDTFNDPCWEYRDAKFRGNEIIDATYGACCFFDLGQLRVLPKNGKTSRTTHPNMQPLNRPSWSLRSWSVNFGYNIFLGTSSSHDRHWIQWKFWKRKLLKESRRSTNILIFSITFGEYAISIAIMSWNHARSKMCRPPIGVSIPRGSFRGLILTRKDWSW